MYPVFRHVPYIPANDLPSHSSFRRRPRSAEFLPSSSSCSPSPLFVSPAISSSRQVNGELVVLVAPHLSVNSRRSALSMRARADYTLLSAAPSPSRKKRDLIPKPETTTSIVDGSREAILLGPYARRDGEAYCCHRDHGDLSSSFVDFSPNLNGTLFSLQMLGRC
jgi:hypothetical protein